MLVTNVGDNFKMLVQDVGSGFGRFGHEQPLPLNISVWHQHQKDVTKILILSFYNCHQNSKIVSSCKSPTSQCHQHACSPTEELKIDSEDLVGIALLKQIAVA